MVARKEAYTQSGQPDVLQGPIALLLQTKELVRIFNDKRPICTATDIRLDQLLSVQNWFDDWEKEIMSSSSLIPQIKARSLLSSQSRTDLSRTIVSFVHLCHLHFQQANTPIHPALFNQDGLENMFCQQRSTHNGANTNPTYSAYCHTINSIILSASIISPKANAGKSFACPLSFLTPKPLVPRQKKRSTQSQSSSKVKIVKLT